MPGEARVGEPVTIKWSAATQGRDANKPAYLIATVSQSSTVRFDGRGFFALAASAANPKGIRFGQGAARAIVPLHTEFARSAGQIDVLPFAAEPLTLEWAIVGTAACGEWTTANGQSSPINVRAGAPRIAARDTFAAEAPEQIVRPLQGAFELHVFKEGFAVYERGSGVQILKRQGKEPTFSPTGRFLVFRPPTTETLEVVDLAARRLLGGFLANMLAWSHGDSFLYVASSHQAWFAIVRTLHGARLDVASKAYAVQGAHGQSDFDKTIRDKLPGNDLTVHESRGGEFGNAWEEWGFALSIDDGVVVMQPVLADAQGRRTARLYDLSVGNSTQPLGSRAAKWPNWLSKFTALPPVQIGIHHCAPMVRRDFPRASCDALAKNPTFQGWNAGEPLWVTTNDLGAEYVADFKRVFDGNYAPTGTVQPATAHPHAATEQMQAITRRLATRLRSTDGDQSYNGVIGANLAGLPQRTIAGIRSSKERAQMQQIGKEIAKLYKPGVATFRDDAKDGSYSTQAFVEPAVKTKARSSGDDGRVVFNFANDGRDLWRWEIGSTTYWLTQTIEAGRVGHQFDFTLLAKAPGSDPRFANVLNAARGRARKADDFMKTPFNQGQEGDVRTELASAFGALSVVGISGDRYLTLVTQPIPQIIAFDLKDWKLACAIPDPTDGAEAVSVTMNAGARHLTQVNADGAIHVYNCETKEAVLGGTYLDDELVVMSPAGYFEGSEDASAYIEVTIAGVPGKHVLAQFAKVLRRPGLVEEVMKGGKPPVPVLATPPLLQLSNAAATAANPVIEAFSASGLAYAQLYADGQPLRRVPATGNRLKLDVPELARPEIGALTAFAVDNAGIISAPLSLARPKAAQRPLGQLHVLTVGIDHYPLVPPRCGPAKDATCDLALAAADARRVADAVGRSKLYAKVNSVTLVDGDASRDAVLSALDQMLAAAQPGDTVAVFFAGHGLIDDRRQLQIGLTTTRLEDLPGTSLAFASISEKLRRAKARVVVLLDVCHGGLADRDNIATNDDAVAQLVTQSGASMIVLAASKGRQESEETNDAGGGRFSVALDRILTKDRALYDLDASGAISVDELYRGIKATVVRESSGRQTPWLSRNLLVGNFDLF